MEELTLALSSILAFCLLFYSLVAYIRPYARLKTIPNSNGKRVLFIVSHPDDETMFFGPTIINLCRQEGTEVFLLCLSTGNYRRQGQRRKHELYQAVQRLGVRQENVILLNYTKLRDDPKVRWREELVSEVSLQVIDTHEIDIVVTFDRGGVSGHKNHTSVYNAMALLGLEKRLPRHVRVYCLHSVNFLRKYLLLIDLPMSFMLSQTAYIASLNDWMAIQKAMACHQSQYVWFRKLYMLFSRYVLINTFDQLGVQDAGAG